MALSDVQRKPPAVLCADVVGYSRLMGADEETASETLTPTARSSSLTSKATEAASWTPQAMQFLAEFASVVAAADCAVEIRLIWKLARNREMEKEILIAAPPLSWNTPVIGGACENKNREKAKLTDNSKEHLTVKHNRRSMTFLHESRRFCTRRAYHTQ